MQKTFGSLKFYQGEEILNIKKTMMLLKANEEAYKIAKDASSLRALGFGFRTTGIIALSVAFGRMTQSRDDYLGTLAWSGALIAISIPFSIFSTKKIMKAVNIYNAGIPTGNNYRKPLEFNILSNNGGIGIGANF